MPDGQTQVSPTGKSTIVVLLLAAVLVVVGLLALGLTNVAPTLIVLTAAAACGGMLLLRHPAAATVAAIFILYTNAADVAVTFHGVPYILGASFIGLWLIPVGQSLWRGERLLMSPAVPWMVAYLVVQIIASFSSHLPHVATRAVVTFFVEGFLVFLLVYNAVRTPRVLRACVWSLLAAGLMMGILPIYQQLTRQFERNFGGFAQTNQRGFRTGEATIDGEIRQRRLSGPIGEQNRFAQFMLMLIPLGIGGVAIAKRWPSRLFAWTSTAVTAAAMVVAFSRGAAVAFVIVVVIGALTRYIRRPHVMGLVMVSVVLLIAMPQYFVRLSSITDLLDLRPSHPLEKADGAVRIRTSAMISSAMVFCDYPLLGMGPGVSQYYTRQYAGRLGLVAMWDVAKTPSHMIFLDVAADTGLAGLFCLLAVCGITLRRLIRARRAARLDAPDLYHIATALILALGAYFASGIFLHFAFIRYFWVIMGLAAATENVITQELSAEHP